MSLSFPLLPSGVPLYAIDFTEKQEQRRAPVKPVWSSDGGISSNLPQHFFGELLLDHPTFAINLGGEHPLHPIDDSTPAGLFAFLGSIFSTMQHWRDESLFPLSGLPQPHRPCER